MNNKETNPCKECLILAACKSREVVSCDLLEEYFIEQLKVIKNYNDSFVTMNVYLPKLRMIRGNGTSYSESIVAVLKRRKNRNEK